MSNSQGVVGICSIRFVLGGCLTWIYLYSGAVELCNTRVNKWGVHVIRLYLHSGVVGVHISRFN